ncbi:sensor histidine kinase [Cellulomonas avistercoris]|uniref:sensor histidine kinase n=1 Tax=Cellulomonas avistercoris TaxID=2762242 RepID=UPI00296B360A|nr:sensor histidine kinase [Cellulomonas avistercoris]
MRAHTLPSVTRRLLVGLDVLVAGLVVVAVLRAPESVPQWATLLTAAVFTGLYGVGRATIRVHEAPLDAARGRWWPAGAWITALIVVWTILLQLSAGALWIAFPLMLLQMHVLGPHRGVLAVAVTTVVAGVDGMLERAATDTSIAPALGPAVGAAVAVAVTLGLEALVRESQERQRMLEELARARHEVAAAEQEAAIATERERLAREIHDTLAQGYSAIELLLRAADQSVGHDDTRTHAYIGQARSTAQENLAEARRFVRALAPADLDGTTLVAALHRIADRTQAAAVSAPATDRGPQAAAPASLTVRVHTSGTPRALPLQVEAALVRIAQSALANVVQHAAARHATLTLTFLPEEVILDVVDDGCGFDPDRHPGPARHGGFGLIAMRSRARELGGSLTIETSPGDGTALAVRVPARDEDGAAQSPPARGEQHEEDR